jgi:hypothetical protein
VPAVIGVMVMPDLPDLKILPFGGPWAMVALGLVAIPGVRDKVLVPLAGAVLRAGIGLVEDVIAILGETREETEDLVAEDGQVGAPGAATG